MKKYLVEFTGTFFLVLTIILAANNQSIIPMAPLAIGLMLAAMTYTSSHISGAYFNPAITLGILMRGKIERNEAAVYMLVQVLASVVAAAMGAYLHSCSGEPAIPLHSNHDGFCSLLAEFFGAFVLVYVFLQVSEAREAHHGLSIGFTLSAAMYAFGGISGGVFNPAASVGASLVGMYASGDLWIYLIGGLAGGAAAATVFSQTHSRED
jgi:aquaporin Z